MHNCLEWLLQKSLQKVHVRKIFFSWQDLVYVNTKTWKNLVNFSHDFGLLQINYFKDLSHELSICHFVIE